MLSIHKGSNRKILIQDLALCPLAVWRREPTISMSFTTMTTAKAELLPKYRLLVSLSDVVTDEYVNAGL